MIWACCPGGVSKRTVDSGIAGSARRIGSSALCVKPIGNMPEERRNNRLGQELRRRERTSKGRSITTSSAAVETDNNHHLALQPPISSAAHTRRDYGIW